MSDEEHFTATGVVYQISSVSRTLYRSTSAAPSSAPSGGMDLNMMEEQPKSNTLVVFDDAGFRQLLIDSVVISSSNYNKWNWDVILRIVEGSSHTRQEV